MADEQNEKGKKQIIAVSGLSTGTYKGMTIFETPYGFFVMLGMMWRRSYTLSNITAWIDEHFKNKAN